MNSPRHRSGHTLIEMMATLAVLMVLGMAAAKLLTAITKVGFRASDRKVSVAMIERLSNDFRVDVAGAESISIDENASSIELIAKDAKIRYAFDQQSRSMMRTENVSADQGKPEQILREQYRLTDRCQPKFVSDETLVTLQLTPQGQTNPWTIEAAKP